MLVSPQHSSVTVSLVCTPSWHLPSCQWPLRVKCKVAKCMSYKDLSSNWSLPATWLFRSHQFDIFFPFYLLEHCLLDTWVFCRDKRLLHPPRSYSRSYWNPVPWGIAQQISLVKQIPCYVSSVHVHNLLDIRVYWEMTGYPVAAVMTPVVEPSKMKTQKVTSSDQVQPFHQENSQKP